MDAQTLTLIACAALLLLAGGGIAAARAARADCARLRAEAEASLRVLEQARTGAEVARAEAQGQARLAAERDERLRALVAEVAALRRDHGEAQGRRADAESRCATATEAVARLEEVERRLRDDAGAVIARLRAAEADHARLQAAHAALRADADGRLASAAREVEALRAVREAMTREFRDLANRTLQETGTQFSAAHHQRLTELLTPFREQVGRFETELRQVHQTADKDRAVLTEQIKALTTQTQAVSQDAANLARALKGDKQRQGAWGEAQLERYLELMGYRRGADYEVQATRTGDEGDRRRPDVVLYMPGGKALVIDSKVSLSAYADAVAAETEEEREAFLKLHARNVRARVDELALRDYHHLVKGSVDWVLLFMPVEGAVSAAWAYDGELTTYAMSRGIGIAYPTTLQMALKTVRHLWDVERRNENAERIADRAGKLYDKLATFIESFESIGRSLDQAQSAHGRALGQLTKGPGNLVGQVQKLKDLGARTGKSLGLDHEAAPDDEPGPEALPPASGDALRVLPAAE